jgi:hypothetical protein
MKTIINNTKYLLLLSLITAICSPVLASEMRSPDGQYMIPVLNIPGGSSASFGDGNYQAYDLKGQGVVGSSESTGYIIRLGGIIAQGALVSTGETGGPTTIEVTINDTGRIRQTWIERTGNDVVLHWGYDSAGPTAVNIWAKLGGDYSAAGTDYSTDLGVVDYGTTSFAVSDICRNKNNYYFRIVPKPLVDPDRMAGANNSITVAKIGYVLVKPYNLIGIPLVPTSATAPDPADHHDQRLDSVIGDQLATGTQIYMYDLSNPADRKYQRATFNGRAWENPFLVAPCAGYWVYRDPTQSDPEQIVSIVGQVVNTDYSGSLGNLYTLISNPYPIVRSQSALAIPAAPGDQLYLFRELVSPQDYQISQYGGVAWSPAMSVLPGKGYWYYKGGAGAVWTSPHP